MAHDATHDPKQALKLAEAAELLGVSYNTLWKVRHQIAWQIPGVRGWRIWPWQLPGLKTATQSSKVVSLSVRGDGDRDQWPFSDTPRQASITSTLPSLAARELDDLLAPKAR